MLSVLAHRGPDESGLYLDDRAALGHCRLSIIDLAGGAQPMHNERADLWITYNGEIFNYLELREELLQKGHVFYSACDTEVLLHMYEEYGPKCLSRLNGQFAFAVWDSRRNELFLARDRVGIRPLHYTMDRGIFYFASEIKSLFAVPSIRRRLDPVGLDQIFTFWTTLPGRTAFEGIHELPAGHWGLLKNGDLKIHPWWTIPFVPRGEYTRQSFDEAREEVDALLTDAIRIRLRADVPVGCYLSGGLDSSGITSRVVQRFNNQVQTFGIRFEESAFDEGLYQDRMVRELGVKHTELMVNNQSIGETFANVIWHTEKPLLRTAPVPLYLLSQVVRDHRFKVVLTGEGADEIFGGYNIFRETKIRQFWSRFPESRRRAELIERLYPYIFRTSKQRTPLTAFFGRNLSRTDHPFYSHLIRWNNTAGIKRFFSKALIEVMQARDPLEDLEAFIPPGFDRWPLLSRAQYLEILLFLSGYLLSSQGDRVAMGHSLEIRVPFLDHRIFEKMAACPPRWKIFGLREKYLLKAVFRDALPEEIVERSKHPYRAPIHQSLLSRRMAGIRERLLSPPGDAPPLFDPVKITLLIRRIEESQNYTEVEGMALAAVASTQILQEQFITRFSPPPAPDLNIRVFIDKRSGTRRKADRSESFLNTK